MKDLLKKKCKPCEGGVIPFDVSEIHKYQKKVDGWDITKDQDEIFFLIKKFTFKNFLESQKFVNIVGKIAEEEEHIDLDDIIKEAKRAWARSFLLKKPPKKEK